MSLPLLVREVMTPNVISVESSSTVRDAAQVMIERGIGSVIVTEAGRPVGIMTERDVLRRVVVKGLDPSKTKVEEVMSSPLVTIRADAYITFKISPWDVAAGILLVEEAGGRVSDFKGNEWKLRKSDLIISNGRLHEKILEIIKKEKI